MRVLLLLALFLVAAPDRENPTPKAKPKPFEEQILGDWQLESVQFGGGINPPKETENRTFLFTPTEIQVKQNGMAKPEDHATYTLDTSKKPIAIDFQPKMGGQMKIEGILKLEGDRLTFCFALGGPRPTEFTAETKTIQAVMQLKRIR
jgi:uncharacterized protein (TIGR03067 family)